MLWVRFGPVQVDALWLESLEMVEYGCGELVRYVLREAVEAWWVCSSDGVLGAKIDGEDGG